MKINYFILLIFFPAGIMIYSGCSASSNSVRYNEKSDKKQKPSSVRFTSEDDSRRNSIDTSFKSQYYLDDEDLPVEKNHVDISSLMDNSSGGFSTVKEKMLMEIIKYLNTPYKFGGNSKNGMDCSAFTQAIFNDCASISLLRTAQDQYDEGVQVDDISALKFGDLVFFDTRRSVKPGHVGIYLGDNLFAHASSKQGVTVSSITQDFYSQRFMGGRRIEELFGSKTK